MPKLEKASTSLKRENTELRKLLKAVLALTVPQDGHDLATVQLAIRDTIQRLDRRFQIKPEIRREAQSRATQAAAANLAARRAELMPLLRELEAQGLSHGAIAKEMNARKIPAPRGGEWKPGSVHNLLKNGTKNR